MFRFLVASIIMINFVNVTVAHAVENDCTAYESRAKETSGVYPVFDENGALSAILSYGEASFFADKRSLIKSAREKAILDAKRAFAAYFSEDISASSIATSLLETAELTEQDGKREGYALEVNRAVEAITSDTRAVIKGMIKADECIDKKGKYVLVTMSWSPKPIKLSSTTQSTTSVTADPTGPRIDSTEIQSSEDPAVCSGTNNIISIDVDGFGQSQNAAIHDGIRLAVSQVFGEVFAASVATAEATAQKTTISDDGSETGSSAEVSAQSTAAVSSTSGVIESYSIISSTIVQSEHRVKINVRLPKYCGDSTLGGKKKIVVLRPTGVGKKRWTAKGEEIAEEMQREIEGLLNETENLTVLNRSNVAEINAELGSISGGGYSVAEVSKIGNKIGADYLVISEFSDFETSKNKINVGGGKFVNMSVIKAQAWIKVIDVVTTNLVMSMRVPLSVRSVSKENDIDAFTLTMAHNLASVVGTKIGGGFTDEGQSMLEASTQKIQNYAQAKERIKKKMKAVEDSAKGLW